MYITEKMCYLHLRRISSESWDEFADECAKSNDLRLVPNGTLNFTQF